MKLRLLLCAKDFSVDQASNLLSAFGIWEEGTSPSFPVLLVPFSVMATFERQDTEPEIQEIRLKVKVSGQEILSQPVQVSFQGKPRMRLITQLNGLPVMVPGLVEVDLMKNGTRLGKYSFPMTKTGSVTATPVMISGPSPQGLAVQTGPVATKPKRAKRKPRRW